VPTRASRARSCSRRRCTVRRTRTSTAGPRSASRSSCWCPSWTTTCGPTRHAAGSRACRRPRSSESTVPSTCGSASPPSRGCSTRSSRTCCPATRSRCPRTGTGRSGPPERADGGAGAHHGREQGQAGSRRTTMTSPSHLPTQAPSRDPLATFPLHDGGGVPLVLLHGFPFDHRMWAACAQHLPPGLRAIAVDLPGAGHSDLDGAPPSIEHAADRVYRTMVAEGEGNAVVVGHSMGGYVALALAERHPGFVVGLGLVSTKSTADTEEARAKRLHVAAAADDTQTVDAVLGMPAALVGPTTTDHRRQLFPVLDSWIRAQSPASVAWSQRAMAARPDRTAVLDRFGAPVA